MSSLKDDFNMLSHVLNPGAGVGVQVKLSILDWQKNFKKDFQEVLPEC